jgi:hypothetical protein
LLRSAPRLPLVSGIISDSLESMPGDGAPISELPPPSSSSSWREFRRARYLLWGALTVLVVLGALLHDLTTASLAARLAWISAVVAVVAYPLGYLLGFRCPRCGEGYLTTGGLRDFLGLGRILWGSRCGRCSLPAGHRDRRAVSSSDLPDSRPA